MAQELGFRVCVRVPATHPVPQVVATVQRAESQGFSGAWLPDSHLNYREVWATLGALAVSTETIEIGPTVTNLLSRHPTVTDDVAQTSRLLKPVAMRLAQLEGISVFAEAGVRIEVPDHTAGAEGDVGHAEDFAQAARELDALVSDEAALWVARNRAIVGSEAEVVARLRELREQGAAGVAISQISGNRLPDELIEAVGPLLSKLSA